jgi:hypothetical protein
VHTPQQQQGVPVHFLKPRKEKEEALSLSFTIFEEGTILLSLFQSSCC